MYKIQMVSLGGTRKDMYTGFETEQEAIDICEDFGWVACPDGGYEWDLDIVEE